MLARRLARCGLTLSGGALATALTDGASAAVPAALVVSTVKTAALVAAGQAAAVTTPAAALMREVVKAMFVAKLKVVVAVAMVAVALGASGFVYCASGEDAAPAAGKPRNELEALRRENELLKLNLEVVLEKVKAQEAELRTLRGRRDPKAAERVFLDVTNDAGIDFVIKPFVELDLAEKRKSDPAQEAEAALKAFREARDKEAKRRAADALEKALKKLREQTK
jgi:hypothetical protein